MVNEAVQDISHRNRAIESQSGGGLASRCSRARAGVKVGLGESNTWMFDVYGEQAPSLVNQKSEVDS